MSAEVTMFGAIDMQVCVPEDWSDEQVIEFAERENPCGTVLGWIIRREGDPALNKDPERQPCKARADHVPVMLDG